MIDFGGNRKYFPAGLVNAIRYFAYCEINIFCIPLSTDMLQQLTGFI
jgi:hypothetical protein